MEVREMNQMQGETIIEFRNRELAEKQAAWNARSERIAEQVNLTGKLVQGLRDVEIENGSEEL